MSEIREYTLSATVDLPFSSGVKLLEWTDATGTVVKRAVQPDITHEEILELMENHLRQQRTTSASDRQPYPHERLIPAAAIAGNEKAARRHNLEMLVHSRGTKQRFARFLGVSPARISALINGTSPIPTELARKIERRVGLPANWLDTPRSENEVPQDVSRFIATLRMPEDGTAPGSGR